MAADGPEALRAYLEEIEEAFQNLPIFRVPHLGKEAFGQNVLEEIGARLYEDTDPTEVFASERSYRLEAVDEGFDAFLDAHEHVERQVTEATDVAAAYEEQAGSLAEGGVDLLVLETFYALDELEAAVEGVRRVTDLPLVCSFSYDRGLRTMMGTRPSQMAEKVRTWDVSAIGANCGTTLDDMLQIVEELSTHAGSMPVWAKPNAGVPQGDPPGYPVMPGEMGVYALRLVESGARIVGGCCGSTPQHVAAIANAMKS